MLQIIGWMMCVYLVIKGMDIASSKDHCIEQDKLSRVAYLACLICYCSAFVFAVALYDQGRAVSTPPSYPALQ